MKLNKRNSTFSEGLSPVIAVVMLVVVVVVIGAVVAVYMLNFGTNSAEQEGPTVGTIFSQSYNQTDKTYSVTITMNREANADYAYVNPKIGDSGVKLEYENSAPNRADYDQDGNEEDVPNNVLVDVGDEVTISGLLVEQRVSVIAVRDGKENVIQEYIIRDKK